MRPIIFAILLGFCFTIPSFESLAQLSKKEKKALKKEKKSLSESGFKDLKDQRASLQSQVTSLQGQVNQFDSKLAEKDKQVAEYQNQMATLRSELETAKSKAAQAQQAQVQQPTNIKDESGVVFKVQIGAFKNKDLSKYLDKGDEFQGEDTEGLKKYTLGVFRDYWEADTFKKYLREMGVKDAWIVSFRDGQRVPIKDVLEGVI
ncbi:MAG: Ezrin/radixin/moesin family protein [Bacteroidetes bacterium]|nr:Ezrin/radixin/moesin family protein [Bacteroidota bacterium]MDA1122051.1 Ezrin/radixin/moesin family protein [Bacteroidota bacterium]